MMEKSNLRRDLGPYIEKAFSDKAEIKEKTKVLLELSQIFFEDLENLLVLWLMKKFQLLQEH